MKKDDRVKLVVLIIVNIIFLALLLILGLNDETKDDYLIQSYILPNSGEVVRFHMWVSVFWSVITSTLQRIIPIFAWQYMLSLVLIFVALNSIVVWIFENIQTKRKIQILIIFLVEIVIFFQAVHKFNFTRTTGLLMSVGVLLIISKGRILKINGWILYFFALILRFNVIYIMFGFGTIAVVHKVSLVYQCEKTERKKELCILGAQIIVALVLAGCIKAAGLFFVNQNQEWVQLKEYNHDSAQVLDYSIKPYDSDVKGYHELGLSGNDYRMVSVRMSNSDPSVFTSDLYKSIRQNLMVERSTNLLTLLHTTLSRMKQYTVYNNLGKLILVSLFISIIFIKKNKKWLPLFIGTMIGAYFFFFVLLGRVQERVTTGVYFFALVTMLYCFDKSDYSWFCERLAQSCLKYKNIIVSGILVLPFLIAVMPYREINIRKIETQKTQIFDYIENDTDKFYALTSYCSNEYKVVNNLLIYNDYWNTWNSFYMTQFVISPHEKSKLKKYSIENLYRDSVDSDTIRFVDQQYIDIVITYIQEHYCQKARVELVNSVGEYNIYRVVSK